MENIYMKPRLRKWLQPIFKTKLGRSWFCYFLYYTRKPYFFGPFAQEIGSNYSKYLSVQPIAYPSQFHDISSYAHVQLGEGFDFTGKKVALIAHFDKDSIIDPYVRYYAKHLKEQGFLPVLNSVSKLNLEEEDKNIFSAIVYRTSPGYDFTSHKAAFTALPSLFQAKEVLMTNDSIFAPFGSLASVFQGMESVSCDFWGACEVEVKPYPFLHSYFILFREKTLQHKAFQDFIHSVVLDDSKDIAYGYEEMLTAYLIQNGLKAGAYLPASSLPYPSLRPLLRAWRAMLQLDMGFVKRLIVTEEERHRSYQVANWRQTFKEYNYPLEYIENYLKRCKNK